MDAKETKFTTLMKKAGHCFWFGDEKDEEAEFTVSFTRAELTIDKIAGIIPIIQCFFCGEFIQFKKDSFMRFEKSFPTSVEPSFPCDYSNGKITEFEVNFPSGRIIISDDLRPAFDIITNGIGTLNNLKGKAEYSKSSAEDGWAFASIGQCYPNVYKDSNGKIVIASLSSEKNEETGEWVSEPIPEDWVKVGKVYTDIGYYSIADYDEWLERGGAKIEDDDHYGTRSVISVTPGKYVSRVFSNEEHFDNVDQKGLVVLGELELITKNETTVREKNV